MALQTQIKAIEASTGLRMEPCLVDVLEGIELLRSENASVASSWLDSITETVFEAAGLGGSPSIVRHVIECGNGSAIIYDGHCVTLDGWATCRAEPVRVQHVSYIHDLLDWALGPFYEQQQQQQRQR